jgi:4-diphosphocytidyl-2C-methyl-D-erythritol kinase
MAGCVRVRAAAKINLHLRVYGRREDGFHGILSLFQAVSLTDDIVIRSLKESDIIEVEGAFDCVPSATTVYKAASLYREACGLRSGLSIAVGKRIPAGAGLGGGSSDAAAVLEGLEALFGGLGERERLAEIGEAVGSDVPFFLKAAVAIVSGRGEVVDPLEGREDYFLVLVDPETPMSTVEAYSLLDRSRGEGQSDEERDPTPEEIRKEYRRPIGDWAFHNSFEPVIASVRPRIAVAKGILIETGASFAAMTGSGSVVFGAFGEEERAAASVKSLSERGFRAHAVLPLARYSALD